MCSCSIDQEERVRFFETLAHFIGQWDCHYFALLRYFKVVLKSWERFGVHGYGSASKEFVLLVKSRGLQICQWWGQILPFLRVVLGLRVVGLKDSW